MKKLLALAALSTVTLSGAAQAGGYGYGHSYGYAPSHGYVTTYVERPVYHVYRPRYVKRHYVKRYYAPSYSYGYHGGY
jgi:hypothetical protein